MKSKLPSKPNRSAPLNVGLAAFLLAATTAAAQTYTITDLGTLGTNSRGTYSQAFCINASGQAAGQTSASSQNMTDPAFLYSGGQLINLALWAANTAKRAESIPPGRSLVIRPSPAAPIAPSSTPTAR